MWAGASAHIQQQTPCPKQTVFKGSTTQKGENCGWASHGGGEGGRQWRHGPQVGTVTPQAG